MSTYNLTPQQSLERLPLSPKPASYSTPESSDNSLITSFLSALVTAEQDSSYSSTPSTVRVAPTPIILLSIPARKRHAYLHAMLNFRSRLKILLTLLVGWFVLSFRQQAAVIYVHALSSPPGLHHRRRWAVFAAAENSI